MADGTSELDATDPGVLGGRGRGVHLSDASLLRAWDPIGVASIPPVGDEYDCMIPPRLHHLDFDGADDGVWPAHDQGGAAKGLLSNAAADS
jgi:hypothetical protein